MQNRVRFCGPSRTQCRTLSLALNRRTRLSEIKTGRVGAIGMDGRAPKIEGDESEERVFHSAKGFMLVEVSMVMLVVLLGMKERRGGRELDVLGIGDGGFTEEGHCLSTTLVQRVGTTTEAQVVMVARSVSRDPTRCLPFDGTVARLRGMALMPGPSPACHSSCRSRKSARYSHHVS